MPRAPPPSQLLRKARTEHAHWFVTDSLFFIPVVVVIVLNKQTNSRINDTKQTEWLAMPLPMHCFLTVVQSMAERVACTQQSNGTKLSRAGFRFWRESLITSLAPTYYIVYVQSVKRVIKWNLLFVVEICSECRNNNDSIHIPHSNDAETAVNVAVDSMQIIQ